MVTESSCRPASLALKLQGVAKTVAGSPHLHPLDLDIVPGQMHVLLGATLAGKTSLLRLLAGLDPPTAGCITEIRGEHTRDVTGLPVRERDLAMVYQQFINYPSLTVRENIASPLRLRGLRGAPLEQRVAATADALRLTAFLDRRPAELSGGQQQRVALARALAKDAGLLLLDEPLVNLDYKLREELRVELLQLLHARATTRRKTHERRALRDRLLHCATKSFAHHRAHRAAKKLELESAGDQRHALESARHGNQGVFFTGIFLGG